MLAEICFTERSDGDFRIDAPAGALAARRQAVMPGGWTWLRQVHGSAVQIVAAPGDRAGSQADVALTRCAEAVLAVQTADCAPVCLVGDAEIAVAHAGWRGLVAGVLGAAVDAMATPAHELRVLIGPCIRPARYEFGLAELAEVAAVAGEAARSLTSQGAPALDVAAAAVSILKRAGVSDIEDLGHDTADERWFSHRVRGDSARQATALRLIAP